MKNCRKCGAEIERGINFCPYCGEDVRKGEEKAFDNGQEQNGGKNNLLVRHRAVLAVIALCAVILAAVINVNRKNEKESVGTEEPVETASVRSVYEEEDISVEEPVEMDSEEGGVADAKEDGTEEAENLKENIEEAANVHGNTNMNLKNGGWVAEQGDWNYYLFWNNILKENVETGEKLCIYTLENSSGVPYHSLQVMGEWVYCSPEEWDSQIFRIKTDGTECQFLQAEWSDDILAWDTWNGKVYVILKEYTSAQGYMVCAAAVDWENGTYEKVFELFDSDIRFFIGFEEELISLDNAIYHYIGMNDGYLYIYRDKNERAVLSFHLETGDKIEYPCGWSFHINDIYVDDSVLYGIGYTVGPNNGLRNDFIERSLGFMELSTGQEYEYNEIDLSESAKINEINRTDGSSLILGSSAEGMTMFDTSDGTVSGIVPDVGEGLCVAHDKIYYKCGGMYCEVCVDGSGWKEIREDDFLPAGILGEVGMGTQSSSENSDARKAYCGYLSENESQFKAVMGEFEKQNEESYKKVNAFLLADLNQDGIPELVVRHPNSYKSDSLYVYTYESGKVVQVKGMNGEEREDAFIDMNSQANGLYDVFGCRQNHLHVVWSAESFGVDERVFILEKGKLKLCARGQEMEEYGVNSYQIDGEEVDVEEYSALLGECVVDVKDMETNAESNREKYQL